MDKRLPTIKEIAKQLNISPSTVSRALHNHHSIGLRTKTKVQELAKALNYQPNQTAIFFKQGKTFTIGVILPNLAESFFSSAISGIEDFAHTKKYNVLLGQSHDDVEREKRIVDTMKNQRVDGLLISISKNTKTYEHFDALKDYKIPVVFFDRIPEMSGVHYVSCNLEKGIQEAVDFLIKRKHRRIGFINGPSSMLATKERLTGFKNSLIKNKITPDKTLIASTDLSTESTHHAMKHLLSLKERPTAIITFNDYVALDAIQFAKKEKVKINKDISFVSFANLPICNYMENPPLASVEQFPYVQGEKAAAMLIDLLNDNKKEQSSDNQSYKIVLDSKLEIHQQ